MYRCASNRKCIAATCIFTFDYIQTKYINMELKQSTSNWKNSKGQIIIFIRPKLDGTYHLWTKIERTKTRWTKKHCTNWYMDHKAIDKNHLDNVYIGLNKMWTKNRGTKIIWTKHAWEQIVCGLNDFGRKKNLDKIVLDQIGHVLDAKYLAERCIVHM